MGFQLEDFKDIYLDQATDLFINNYKNEKKANPYLPLEIINDPQSIRDSLSYLVNNTGVALFCKNKLMAFMISGYQFSFKGHKAIMVPEFAHGSQAKDTDYVYRLMYKHLAKDWSKECQLHIIGHFAHDESLKRCLFELGYGAILSERLRKTCPIKDINSAGISEEKDYEKLIPINIEHFKYYPQSPIFIFKNNDAESNRECLKEHQSQGDVFLVYKTQNEIVAYAILGKSSMNAEGFLLQDTNTAQIKSMYAKPKYRGQGIGKKLLQKSLEWAKDNQYERLFVEHESANFFGGLFWKRHFKAYLHFSMRYIDKV